MTTHYETLGLEHNATAEQIKLAYRQLSKKHHPDRNGGSKESEKLFLEVQEAYKVLKDPALKEAYDAKLAKGGKAFHSSKHRQKTGLKPSGSKRISIWKISKETLSNFLASTLKRRRFPQA